MILSVDNVFSVRSSVRFVNWQNIFSGYRGAVEDKGPGGRDMCIPTFKTLTLNKETLWPEDSMRDGYHPKMLLYALDELFYVYAQIKNSQRVDNKLVLTYEILCISANRCTDWQNGIEKTGMPDALALLNVNDVHHL